MRKEFIIGVCVLSCGLVACGTTQQMPENSSALETEQIAEVSRGTNSDTQKMEQEMEQQKDVEGMQESDLSINQQEDFYITEISDELFEKMQGKTFKEDCTLPREDLRYLHVLHVDFEGNTQEGELVCNKVIAEDLLEIFQELYAQNYQIEKIRLMDDYDADDETAMRDNNTSCFNFRFISHTTRVSKHGLGVAVDINTLYNPYTKVVDGEQILEPATAGDYVDRSKDFPHKIDEKDLVYQLFTEHGFEWGGSWEDRKDYQHFELPDEAVEKIQAQLMQ